jgi:type II secretion system protein G
MNVRLSTRLGQNGRGFTLIELLVVIAIIGLLSSVVLASLNTARAKARDAKRFSDLAQVQTALEMYYSDYGSYPVRSGWMGTTPSCYGGGSNPNAVIPGLVPTYMPSIPQDPSPALPSYCYLYNSNGADYKFLAYETIESGKIPKGGPHSRYAASCSNGGSEASAAVYSAGAACW